MQDPPYIAMLLLALLCVVLRLPSIYWGGLARVFGVICIATGWRQFETREARLQLIATQALSWLGVVIATFVLFSYGVQGMLNVASTSLALLTMLALGTFLAGVQARVWRISAVGAILFLAVPGIGWLKQSAALLGAATLVIIGIGGLTWWLSAQRRNAA